MSEIVDMERVLEDAFKSVRKGRLYRVVRIFTQWSRIVGETNARIVWPVAVRGKTLTIKSEDSAWVDRLKYMEADLLRRIAEQIGEGHITRLRFVIGEKTAPAQPRRLVRRPLSVAKTQALRRLLKSPALEGKEILQEDFETIFTGLSAQGKIRDGKPAKRRR